MLKYYICWKGEKEKLIWFGWSVIYSIAILKFTHTYKIIIQTNFRAPVNKYLLELPGALIKNDAEIEDPLWELKEETGFGVKPLKTGGEHLEFHAFYFDP